MDMEEYSKGIYSLGEVDVSKKHRLVIAVHPYFYGEGFDGVYRNNLRKILRDDNKAVLIMEGKRPLPDNIKYLTEDLNDTTKNRFIVKTKSFEPEPIGISMKGLFNFASGFRQPLSFAGGRYFEYEEEGEIYWKGCLAEVYKSFLEAGFNGRIIKSVTFT